MIKKTQAYPLKRILEEYELPVCVQKGSWSKDFYFRVEKIENELATGTAFRDGKVWERKSGAYSYKTTEMFFLVEKSLPKESADPIEESTVEEDGILEMFYDREHFFYAKGINAEILKLIIECNEDIVGEDIVASCRYKSNLVKALEENEISYSFTLNDGRTKAFKCKGNRYDEFCARAEELILFKDTHVEHEPIVGAPSEDEPPVSVNDPRIDDIQTKPEDSCDEIEWAPFTENDATTLLSVRDIYVTQKFKRSYKKADSKIKKEIDEILNNFRNNSGESLWQYLMMHNNKPLRGAENSTDKLYIDNSSGYRLAWISADEIMPNANGDAIIVIDFQEHDKQSWMGKSIGKNNKLELLFKEYDDLNEDALVDFEDKIPPSLFYKNRFIPQLNINQRLFVSSDPPMLLQGCAGSGKTQVSLEIFNDLLKEEKAPTYITFTRELVEDVKEKLVSMPEHDQRSFNDDVLTINDFFISKLNLKKSEILLADEFTFKRWKESRYIHKNDNKYKQIDCDFAWTYIRGVIKGGAINNSVPTRDEFEKWMSSHEGMDSEKSNLIYDVFKDYELACKKDNRIDDNQLAELVLSKQELKNSVDFIIADEIQDLTYTQIKALIHCVKDYRIFLCGDINQRVNPTIIDLDAISGMFYQNGRSALNVERLGSSFRSGKNLVKFLNYISGLRREYIALQDLGAEVEETSLREDGDGLWATICDNSVNLTDVCHIAVEAANCIVIVPSEEKKKELISRDSKIKDRVKTVKEMKGLEYDNVIICDFISHKKKDFEEIFSLKKKRDTFGRLLFNLLYVACTRARDRLIIYESDCEKHILDKVYKDITIKDSLENVKGFMQLEVDDEGWLREARRLEELHKYDMAISAYSKITTGDYETDIIRCELMDNSVSALKMEDNAEKWYTLNDAAQSLMEMEEYDYAAKVYEWIERECDEIDINAIYAYSLANRPIDSEKIIKVIELTKEKELIEDAHKLCPYTDDRIEENEKKIDAIKSALEVLNNGR